MLAAMFLLFCTALAGLNGTGCFALLTILAACALWLLDDTHRLPHDASRRSEVAKAGDNGFGVEKALVRAFEL